jgi:GT2 family glycosyltransferase
MDVSVVIVTFNTFDFTCQCIQHIVDKTKNVNYEIILVDNASTDKSPSLFLEQFPDLILITSKENVGFAKGNNLGIAKAKGEFILLLNSDAFLLNNAIALTLNFLKTNSKIAAATGRLEYPNGKLQHNCQRFPSVRAQIFELLRLQKILPATGEKILFGSFFKYNTVAYPDWVWGTFFMFRQSLLDELPARKLPDDFFMYGEDVQWCMEFRKRGYKIAFLPEPRIQHLLRGSGGSKENLIALHHQKFLEKYYPFWKIKLIGWLDQILRN